MGFLKYIFARCLNVVAALWKISKITFSPGGFVETYYHQVVLYWIFQIYFPLGGTMWDFWNISSVASRWHYVGFLEHIFTTFYKRFFPGGANQFADAFAVAERMRKEFPEEFDLLSTVKVWWWSTIIQTLEWLSLAWSKIFLKTYQHFF